MGTKKFDVPANVLWFSTGIVADYTYGITIVADPSGRWTANSANGSYDANGLGIPAKTGYCLPTGTEGALIAMVKDDLTGAFEIIQVGLGLTHRFGHRGHLYLSINDDPDKHWGNGFSDNKGSISVTVTY